MIAGRCMSFVVCVFCLLLSDVCLWCVALCVCVLCCVSADVCDLLCAVCVLWLTRVV